jgi:hypothetical protein
LYKYKELDTFAKQYAKGINSEQTLFLAKIFTKITVGVALNVEFEEVAWLCAS